MSIAYLVEPTYVTTTGKLRGKSLRVYEVNLTKDQFHRGVVTSTGYMYIVKNGKITKQKTTAKLANKYLGYNAEVQTTYNRNSSWKCLVFSTPEIALYAKNHAISVGYNKIQQQINDAITHLAATSKSISDLSFIVSDHPELFI